MSRTHSKTNPAAALRDPEAQQLREDFPSIDLAYEISISSFEQSIRRLDFIDTKNLGLLNFYLAGFLAIPTLGRATGIGFRSWLFYFSVAFLLTAVLLILWATKKGQVHLLDPAELFKNHLDDDPIVFKRDIICAAGDCFKSVTDLVERKWRLGSISLILFGAAVCLAAAWVALGSAA